MAKTEIDLAILANALSESITKTILSFAAPAKPNDAEENPIGKKNKPKKIRVKKIVEEEIEPEGDSPEEFLERNSEIKNSVNTFLVAARNENFQPTIDSGRNIGKRVPFKKKVRPNLFKDDFTIATAKLYTEGKGKKRRLNAKGKSLYPEPTERRDPDKEYEYKCDVCQRSFKAFASYVPTSVDGESQPQIRCQRCNCK